MRLKVGQVLMYSSTAAAAQRNGRVTTLSGEPARASCRSGARSARPGAWSEAPTAPVDGALLPLEYTAGHHEDFEGTAGHHCKRRSGEAARRGSKGYRLCRPCQLRPKLLRRWGRASGQWEGPLARQRRSSCEEGAGRWEHHRSERKLQRALGPARRRWRFGCCPCQEVAEKGREAGRGRRGGLVDGSNKPVGDARLAGEEDVLLASTR